MKENEGLIGEAEGAEYFAIHTKAPGFKEGCLQKDSVRKSMAESLEKMHIDHVGTFFLHSPDPATPLEETLEAVHELYQQRKFGKFGLSNFNTEETRRVYDICAAQGYMLPTIVQGNYSAVARHVEEDFFALLRELKISFWVYSPLAGGFLAKTSEYFRNPINRGRWDPNSSVGKLYNHLYNKPHLVAALDTWGEAADKAHCTRAALAYRWVKYHSLVDAACGDCILMGASTVDQVTETLECLNDGPLPKEVVEMIDGIWEDVKDESPFDNYHD